MTKYNDIKGATELVNKYKDDFDTIESSIAELENRRTELEGKLDDSNDKFKLESIEKNAKTKQSLNLVNQYLKEAKQRKEELVKEANKSLVSEAKALVKEHRENVKNNHNDINKKIAESLYQARALQKEMDKLEYEELQKINSFITDLSPYFEDEAEFRKTKGGMNQSQFIKYDLISGGSSIFTKFPEPVYYVKGLVKPYKNARMETNNRYEVDSEARYNKLFGVE